VEGRAVVGALAVEIEEPVEEASVALVVDRPHGTAGAANPGLGASTCCGATPRGHPDRRVVAGRSVVTEERQCSKVHLVDERDRVLLFSGIDRTKPDVPPWWFEVGRSRHGEPRLRARPRRVA
jgi:hypothetical protein